MKTTTNRFRYNSKEQLTEVEAIDYGARQYSAELCRWLQVDPLAEKTHNFTPYHFCHANPIVRVDNNGMSDYFDFNGNYLGSDNSKDDFVRIISRDDWQNIHTQNENTVGNAMQLSIAFSDAEEMSTDAILAVYEHYNMSGLQLEARNGSHGGMYYSPIRKKIGVQIEANKMANNRDWSNHANNIINGFAHENQHYLDHKKLGEYYFHQQKFIRENSALNAQIKHSSWPKTTDAHKRAVHRYQNQYSYFKHLGF